MFIYSKVYFLALCFTYAKGYKGRTYICLVAWKDDRRVANLVNYLKNVKLDFETFNRQEVLCWPNIFITATNMKDN